MITHSTREHMLPQFLDLMAHHKLEHLPRLKPRTDPTNLAQRNLVRRSLYFNQQMPPKNLERRFVVDA